MVCVIFVLHSISVFMSVKFNKPLFFQSGASVEVKLPDKKETVEGVIVKIQDLSQYTVGK